MEFICRCQYWLGYGWNKILNTTYGGTSWDSQTSGIGYALHGVHFVDVNTGWAVGYSGTILKTTYGGINWTSQTSGTTNDLYGVYFAAVNTGWAVGNNSTILNTTDGGTSWASQTSGIGNALQEVHFVNVNTGWAVGYSGTILKTTDGGINWTSQTSGTTNNLLGVYFTDENTGWAVGNSGTILKTSDGGASWIIQASGTTRHLYEVYFADINIGWAVGRNGTIVNTTDGGANWNIQASGTTNYLYGVHFADVNTGWAVGQYGTIVNTTNGGASWFSQTSGTSNLINGVNFTDIYNGWAVGNTGTILKYKFPLASPVLISPINNVINHPLNTALIWQPVENASSYSVQVSLTNDFAELVVNESGIVASEYQVNNLECNSTYFWRVKAKNGDDVSTWSDIWSFNTIPWKAIETNNSSSIIVPTSVNPMIGDRVMENGDMIGLFYQNDENEWTCAGYGIWNEENLGITVWGDNDTTDIKMVLQLVKLILSKFGCSAWTRMECYGYLSNR
jgi:photosystem II stability/assembly factor-like uncharacterized protein